MGFFSILGKPPYGGWFSYEKDFEEAVSKNYNIHILHFENLKRVRYTFLSMRGSKNIFRGGGSDGYLILPRHISVILLCKFMKFVPHSPSRSAHVECI